MQLTKVNPIVWLCMAILFVACNRPPKYLLTTTITTLHGKKTITISQDDLDNYLKSRKITDTLGKTNGYLILIRNAKAMTAIGFTKTTYAEALKAEEEHIRLRNMVDKVLVIKNERKMYLLKNGKTVKTFRIALGPNPIGQKEYEGDGKTPEGTYTLDWQRHETPTFHSFHISYPNAQDLERAKKKGLVAGSNIMVHGTSNGTKNKKDWTNGCIALNNTDMTSFKKIVFQDTKIEIRP